MNHRFRLTKELNPKHRRIVGIIPAAGLARRIGPLPFSKELFPVNNFFEVGDVSILPQPVCIYLLRKMQRACVTETYIIIRHGKWDIPNFLRDGREYGLSLAYLMMNLPYGVPYSVDQAYPFVKDATVVFGFPDILFRPSDAYEQLLLQLGKKQADLVLGLFPIRQSCKWDMVEVDSEMRIIDLQVKPERSELKRAWIIGAWTPVFSQFLHDHLKQESSLYRKTGIKRDQPYSKEMHMSEAIKAAIGAGIVVMGCDFPNGACIDIGTPEDLLTILHPTS